MASGDPTMIDDVVGNCPLSDGLKIKGTRRRWGGMTLFRLGPQFDGVLRVASLEALPQGRPGLENGFAPARPPSSWRCADG